jgi:hypothetical protein
MGRHLACPFPTSMGRGQCNFDSSLCSFTLENAKRTPKLDREIEHVNWVYLAKLSPVA